MPSDITGTEIIQQNKETGERAFSFHKGPLFSNIVLADEITCDSQRIWTKDGKSLDKDVFRQGDNMNDVEDVYNYIHKLIDADKIN